jgi:hypothetical protein
MADPKDKPDKPYSFPGHGHFVELAVGDRGPAVRDRVRTVKHLVDLESILGQVMPMRPADRIGILREAAKIQETLYLATDAADAMMADVLTAAGIKPADLVDKPAAKAVVKPADKEVIVPKLADEPVVVGAVESEPLLKPEQLGLEPDEGLTPAAVQAAHAAAAKAAAEADDKNKAQAAAGAAKLAADAETKREPDAAAAAARAAAAAKAAEAAKPAPKP